MVEKTLTHMRQGGIYDQLGFGFHRYSTDAQWLVPHFEKMLYDQALLAHGLHRSVPSNGSTQVCGCSQRDHGICFAGFSVTSKADSIRLKTQTQKAKKANSTSGPCKKS